MCCLFEDSAYLSKCGIFRCFGAVPPHSSGWGEGTNKNAKYHSLRTWQSTKNLNGTFSEFLKSSLFKSYKLACYYLCIDKNPNQEESNKKLSQQFI